MLPILPTDARAFELGVIASMASKMKELIDRHPRDKQIA
jgi:hypothetical protein